MDAIAPLADHRDGGGGAEVAQQRRFDGDAGRILAGGSFFFYQNLSGGELLRLNVDGTHDNSFQTRSFSGTVNAVGLRGEKIDVAGNFGSHETTNGARTDRPGFARLNADGTVDTAFVPPAFRIEGALNTFVAASERKTLAAAPAKK